MIPILFEHNEAYFSNHGLGDLVDCTECMTEINNEGEYELSLTYPVNAEMFSELKINRIILAEVNHYTDEPNTPWLQLFRIYGYEKPINGLQTIKAQHISYDLCDIPVKPFGADGTIKTATAALSGMVSNIIPGIYPDGTSCPFTFTTDISIAPQNQDGFFKVDDLKSIRTILLDGDDSIKGTFGGDLIFDNFNISLKAVGGQNRGVVLEYGVDITDLSVEENISEMITGIYPYWKGRDPNNQNASDTDEFVYGSIQEAQGPFDRKKISAVDLSEYFPDSKPTAAQLNEKAAEWITANHIGEPDISCTVSYAALGQDIRMYDEVKVRFPKMGIDVTAKVSKYKYNVLLERCEEIEISNVAHSSMWKGLEDASRLKVGLIPPKRIGNGAIGGSQIAGGAVGGQHIQSGAVDTPQIADGAVGTAQINDNAVKEEKIYNGSVTQEKIGKSAVKKEKIEDEAVAKEKTSEGVRGTLDQVAINTSTLNNIITGYFSGRADFVLLSARDIILGNNAFYCSTININGSDHHIVTWGPVYW